MLIKPAADIRSSEITDERQYLDRRTFIRGASAALAGAAAMSIVPGMPGVGDALAQTPIPNLKKGPFNTDEPPNKVEDITGYNNFYEFGLDKEDPARYAGKM
jgi:methionine sulfoxide reductase catalytic subunit